MPHRIEKVSSAIHKALAEQLNFLELPGMVTISRVEVTPDLKYAKVWVTVLPESAEQAMLKVLEHNLYELQGELNRRLRIRKTPRIAFSIDHSEEYAANINSLLKTIDDEKS